MLTPLGAPHTLMTPLKTGAPQCLTQISPLPSPRRPGSHHSCRRFLREEILPQTGLYVGKVCRPTSRTLALKKRKRGSTARNWLLGSHAGEVTICIDNYEWSLPTDLRVLTQTGRRQPLCGCCSLGWRGQRADHVSLFTPRHTTC